MPKEFPSIKAHEATLPRTMSHCRASGVFDLQRHTHCHNDQRKKRPLTGMTCWSVGIIGPKKCQGEAVFLFGHRYEQNRNRGITCSIAALYEAKIGIGTGAAEG